MLKAPRGIWTNRPTGCSRKVRRSADLRRLPSPLGAAFARVCLGCATLTHAIIHLDWYLYWLYDRWAYSRALGDDMLSYSGVLLSGVGAFVGLWLGSRASR